MPQVVVTQLIVDSSGAQKGVADFEAAMDKAKASAVASGDATASAFERAQQRWQASLAKTDPVIRAQISMQQALARQQAINNDAIRLGIVSQEAAVVQLDRVRAKYQVYVDVASGASKAQIDAANSVALFARGLGGAIGPTNGLANAHAGLTTQAMALSHSIRGATEMLAQGVPPTRILAMELNNITYAATGPGGLAGAFKSLTQGALGTALKFAALASPLLILLGLMTATSVAAYKSAEANREFENSLAGIGRTGSASLADVDQAAKRTSASVGVSISQAQEWAQSYATTGKVGGDVLMGLTADTQKYAEATGQDTTDAVKALADAFADPAKGAETLNNQLGFLNATQMTHIKQLADEGDRLGAQKALYAGLDKALDETANVHVHGLVKVWQDVATWASNAWHAMVLAAGGGNLIEQLAQAQKHLALAQSQYNATPSPTYLKQLQEAQKDADAAKKALDDFNSSVLKSQKDVLASNTSISAKPILDKIFPDEAKLQELRKDYETLSNAEKAAIAAGKDPSQYQATSQGMKVVQDAITRVTDAYNKYGGSAGVAHQIALLQAQSAATTSNAEKGEIQTKIHLLQTLGDLTPAQQRLTAAIDAGTVASSRHAKAVKDDADAADRIINKYAAQYDRQTEQFEKLRDRLSDYNRSLAEGVEFAGQTSDERERLLAVEKEIKLAYEAQVSPNIELVNTLVRERQEAQKLGQTADGIQNSFQDFFTNVFSHGKNAFSQLVDSIKQQFAQLLSWLITRAIAQPIIVPIIESVTGGALNIASALGAGGASGVASNGIGFLGSLGNLSSAGSLTGSSGFLGQIGSSISGAANWLTSGINSIGASLGFGTTTTAPLLAGIPTIGADGVVGAATSLGATTGVNLAGTSSLFGATSLSGLLGGGLGGLGVGSLVGSLLGGNSTGSAIGGALGGIVGSIIPGLGTILGSALGGALGGLFGGKPSAHRATANFDDNYLLTGITGTKLTTQGQQLASSAGQGISQVVQALENAGLTLTNNISKLTISTSRDKSFLTTDTGQRIDVGKVGDAQAAVQGTLDYLFKGLTSTDTEVQKVIAHYKALGGITSSNADQFAQDVQFAKSLESISFDTTKQLSQTQQAMQTISQQFDDTIQKAKALGLDTANIVKAEKDAFDAIAKQANDNNKAALESIIAPALAQFDAMVQTQQQRVDDAKAVGASLDLVNQLNTAEMQKFVSGLSDSDRQLLVSAGALSSAQVAMVNAFGSMSDGVAKLIDRANAAAQAAQSATQAWSSAQQAIDQSRKALLISSDLAVSPKDQYLNALSQYNDLRTKALSGNAQSASDLAGFASTYLQADLAYKGATSSYGSDYTGVQADLAKVSAYSAQQVSVNQKAADLAQQSVDVLTTLQQQIASGQPSLSILQSQLDTQGDIVTAIENGNVDAAAAAATTSNALVAALNAAVAQMTKIAETAANTSNDNTASSSAQASAPASQQQVQDLTAAVSGLKGQIQILARQGRNGIRVNQN
jgi:phage-related minor tail protein